jgi:hypothetical protein
MVEEIRTYLLNDMAFSRYAYIDKDYSPILLSETFSSFRNCLLIGNNEIEPEVQIWRSNLMVDAIYNDLDLSKIALRNFDSRRIPDKNDLSNNFLPTIKQSFYDDRVLIKSDNQNYPQDGIYNKRISLTKKTNNILSVSYLVDNKSNTRDQQIIFTFRGNISNFLYIPDTRLRIGFLNCSHIPFNQMNIKLMYPYFFNVNNLIDNVYQIPGIEELIWLNKKAYEDVFDIYSKTDRSYKKVLCLLLAYAISLKWQ